MSRPTEEQLRADWQSVLRFMPDRKYEEYVADRIAPPGKVWVCGACGKRSEDRHDGPGGWDESCMLNSFLVDEQDGRP